jgi:uncharacterized membrane protein
MASYRTRLQQDLERWIEQGLVPAASREPILAQTRKSQSLDGATALAAVGGLLLGVAVIAFVAANWSAIPRIGRFGLILALFLAVSGGAAWAHARDLARNLTLLVAALVYAAAIGLTGQIFDIAGDPVAALHAAGLAAALLAIAGRSSAAAMAAVALIGFGDFASLDDRGAPWVAVAAPAALALAWLWRSKPLTHVASIALPAAAALILAWLRIDHPLAPCLAVAAVFTIIAFVSRRLNDEEIAPIVFGWAVWSGLGFLAFAGVETRPLAPVFHRTLWLAVSAGVIALGMHDRKPMVTAAGVVAFGGAIAAILFDLGLGLMTASAVFAAVALAALFGGWLLRRGRRA